MLELLQETKVDTLITEAGSISPESIFQTTTLIKNILWVVEKTSRQMGWADAADNGNTTAEVVVWHDMIAEMQEIVSSIPYGGTAENDLAGVVAVWHNEELHEFEIVEFTQKVGVNPR